MKIGNVLLIENGGDEFDIHQKRIILLFKDFFLNPTNKIQVLLYSKYHKIKVNFLNDK